MNIKIFDPIGQDGIDYLVGKGYVIVDSIKDADAFIVRGKTKVIKELIAQAKHLKVIARSGTGVDNIDLTAAKERGIVVVNAPGANTESVAEHVFSFMLALARNLVPTVTTFKSGAWAKSDFRGMELMGKTLGIVGFGHIGKRVAELGKAFGMEVIIQVKGDSLDPVLSADFVSLHVPLTAKTRGMIGTSELVKMKKTAYLINTARGALVDEQALVVALQNGTIAGAALDVFTTEPLPSESDMLKLRNILVTPHVAANSRESENRASLMVAIDVDRVLQGEEPNNPV